MFVRTCPSGALPCGIPGQAWYPASTFYAVGFVCLTKLVLLAMNVLVPVPADVRARDERLARALDEQLALEREGIDGDDESSDVSGDDGLSVIDETSDTDDELEHFRNPDLLAAADPAQTKELAGVAE